MIETADEARQSVYPGTIRTTVLDIDANQLSIPWPVLRVSAFRPIAIEPSVRELVTGSVEVTASDEFTPALVDSYLLGVAELTLRSALDLDPDHAGTTFMRITYAKLFIESHCAEPNLTAVSVARGWGSPLAVSTSCSLRRTALSANTSTVCGSAEPVHYSTLRTHASGRSPKLPITAVFAVDPISRRHSLPHWVTRPPIIAAIRNTLLAFGEVVRIRATSTTELL
nr:hypothetical protein [Rhodococcus qingshengii]